MGTLGEVAGYTTAVISETATRLLSQLASKRSGHHINFILLYHPGGSLSEWLITFMAKIPTC